MMLGIFIILLFISSFILFTLSRHDFVLLRQNISLRVVFDKAVLIILFSSLIARIFYLVNEELYSFFLNPLSFLHVGVYWGFNFLGFFTALAVAVWFFFRKRKNFMRIFDIYSLSFFPLVLFQLVSFGVAGLDLRISSSMILVLLVLYGLFLKLHHSFKIKDGAISFLILIITSLVYIGYTFITAEKISLYSPIQIVGAIVIAVSLYCLLLIYFKFFQSK